MENIKKILIALGFSEYAKGIFDYGVMQAKAFDADIVAVNIINSRDVNTVEVITNMGYDVDEEHYVTSIEAERRKMLQTLIDQSAYPAERIKIAIQVGNPTDELLRMIIKEKIDLVVMGTKGRTDLEHLLVGSVADKLFRYSPVPVVFHRTETQSRKLKERILQR